MQRNRIEIACKLLLICFLFAGCYQIRQFDAIKEQQAITYTDWMTLGEIKRSHGLKSKDLQLIIDAVNENHISTRYNLEKECVEYDAYFDYSIFKR